MSIGSLRAAAVHPLSVRTKSFSPDKILCGGEPVASSMFFYFRKVVCLCIFFHGTSQHDESGTLAALRGNTNAGSRVAHACSILPSSAWRPRSKIQLKKKHFRARESFSSNHCPFPSRHRESLLSPACSKRVRRVVQAHDNGDAPAAADRARAIGDGVRLSRRVVAAAVLGKSAKGYAARGDGHLDTSTATSREEGFGGARSCA